MASPAQNQSRWIVMIVFMVAHAVNDGFLWVIPPLLPALRDHFHLSYTEMGSLYTLFRISGDILQAPVAYLVHFAPASVIMTGGFLWTSVGMFLASLASGYGMLALSFAASGIGRATYHPLAATVLSRVFGREALGRAIALHMTGSAIGHVIAPFLVGFLLIYAGWRSPIMVWSGLGILSGLILYVFLRNQRESLTHGAKVLSLPFFSRPIGIYLLAVSVWGIAQTALMTFLPLFLVDYRGFSKEKAAAIYGIMSLSGAICRPFLGALMDRMGRRKPVIIGGFIFAGLSILGLATMKSFLIMYLCIALLGVFGSGHSGLSDTFMIEMIPSNRREETIGFIFSVRMSIGSLAPILVGLIAERTPLPYIFMTLAVIPMFTASIISLAEERPTE
jgi:FSR family fosmidomycin resistance protein-like MFS transporter